jgi:hypothetical protein
MAFVRVLVLCGLILVTNGCTVLGVAADLAIISASDNENRRESLSRNGIEPFFTQEGLKHDIEFVKNLMAEKELKPVSQEANQKQVLTCKNVLDGKQQCYAPEYYKDMYIENAASKDKQSKFRKD